MYWFVTNSEYGQIYVGICKEESKQRPHHDNKPEAVKMAMAMNKQEFLIKEVEDWLNTGFMLRPVSIIPSSLHALHLNRKSVEQFSHDESIVVGFHANSLEKIPAPTNDQLHNIEIQTSELSVNLVLAHIDVTNKELDKLRKGSILIIPESFENEWHIGICSVECNDVSCRGVIGSDVKTIRITNRVPQKNTSAMGECDTEIKDDEKNLSLTVSIQENVTVPFEKMLCWRQVDAINIERSLKQFIATIFCENHYRAFGHLISIASGYGVYIES